LNVNKNVYLALLKLAAGILGTNTLLNGLSCVPTSPASLSVIVNPGEIYSLETLDPSAYSDLGTDSRTVLKQGIMTGALPIALQQPSTIGYSVNYLIEAAFSEADINATILPYVNAGNPQQPYSGPGGTGASQNTTRQDTITIQAKTGVAAPTGSQATPTVDAGYTALFVVTVDYGQTAIGSNHIAQAAGAPFITETLTQKISQATADLRYVQLTALALIGAAGQIPYGNASGQLDPSWLGMSSIAMRYPVILTGNNMLIVAAAAGNTIEVAAGQSFSFRDCVQFSTGAGWTSPMTAANQIYHLRFVFSTASGRANMGASFYAAKSISGGSFYLVNVTDSTYNASALAENNPAFDTQYDDMLVAKITTNSGNVATITPFINTNKLCSYVSQRPMSAWSFVANTETDIPGLTAFANNYARSFNAIIGGNFSANEISATGAQAIIRLWQNATIAVEGWYNDGSGDGNVGASMSPNIPVTIHREDVIQPTGNMTTGGAMVLDNTGLIDGSRTTLQSLGSSFYVQGTSWN
jgi:hypothetical protein